MNTLLICATISMNIIGAVIAGMLSCISDDIDTLKDKIDLLMKERKIRNGYSSTDEYNQETMS